MGVVGQSSHLHFRVLLICLNRCCSYNQLPLLLALLFVSMWSPLVRFSFCCEMFISAMVLVAWIGVQFGSRLVHVELTGRGS